MTSSRAGPGTINFFGGQGPDIILGDEGRDEIFGGLGDDVLLPGHDSDAAGPFGINSRSAFTDTAGSRIQGGPGQDMLIGGNRWDRIVNSQPDCETREKQH